jgi:hypothetical protein
LVVRDLVSLTLLTLPPASLCLFLSLSKEDQKLDALVKQHGQKKWAQVARELVADGWVGRIGKQCRERYNNKLNPDNHKGRWAPEEVRGSSQSAALPTQPPTVATLMGYLNSYGLF